MQNHQHKSNLDDFHLPEWETTSRHRGQKPTHTDHKPNVIERALIIFERLIPRRRTYFGVSRKIVCIAASVLFIILLALILGLAIGLSKKSRYTPLQRGFLMAYS